MRVVVVGGGIAGAELIRCAHRALELVLIEPKPQIECQALYPEFLSGKVSVEDITAPLKPFCERVGATLIGERAVSLEEGEGRGERGDERGDKKGRGGVVVCEHSRVEYDVVVVATGATQNYYGIEGAERAFSIHTLEEAIRARRFIERHSPEKIVIVGSGLTGVETACELAESLDATIYLVEMMDRVLPTFREGISSLVARTLESRGVRVLTSRGVHAIEEGSVVLSDGSVLQCDMVIWTAGIRPSSFVEHLPLPKRNGWLLTDPYLRVRGDVFAIGDAAWVEVDGKLATKTGIEAERQARHTAENLRRLERGAPLLRYRVRASTDSQVALISLGCGCAVGVYRGMCIPVPSRLIYAVKSWIDRSFIRRFK